MVNTNQLMEMFNSENQDDVDLGYAISKNYKGTDKKVRTIINYFKLLKNNVYIEGMTYVTYPLSLNLSYLDLSNKNITHKDLPENLINHNYLVLNNNKGLKKLPNNLTANHLIISNTNIKEWPRNLKICNIDMTNTPIGKYYECSRFNDFTNEEVYKKIKNDIELKGGKVGRYFEDLIEIE